MAGQAQMNGKQKGSEFERTISKRLSLWWSKNEDDNLFWRTQNSGGRFTSRQKQGKDTLNQDGDIASTSVDSVLFSNIISIECKAYKDINLWSLITEKGLLIDWWTKHLLSCNNLNKMPILICKQNNKPILFICNEELSDILIGDCQTYPLLKRTFEDLSCMHFYLLDDVLKIDIDKFKESLSNVGKDMTCQSQTVTMQ